MDGTMTRGLQSRHRSLVRFTAIEERADGGAQPFSVKPCAKYAGALASVCLVGAVALTFAARGGTMKVSESGVAISKAGARNSTYAHFASCQIENDLKVNCGHAGITQPQCVARGCCFRPSRIPGIPWCFVSKEEMDPQCTVPRQDKINCGFRGISQDQCEDRGCCYANAGAERIPWCFQKPGKSLPQLSKATAEECAVPGKEKVECGFAGITEPQCLRKGCCYRAAENPDEPFCYDKWIIVTGHEAKEAEQCGAMAADRIECGYNGIPSDECWKRGCCYERIGEEGVPFCFQKTIRSYRPGDRVVAQECAVPDDERFDCGFQEIQPEQCRAKGCCYAPAEKTGAPYCFYKEPTEAGSPLRRPNRTATVTGSRRVEVSSASTLVSGLLAFAGVAICLGACLVCLRLPHCNGDGEQQSRCTRLDESDKHYHAIQDHFRAHWNTTLWPTCQHSVPVPAIKEIYEIDSEAHVCIYEAKQLELEDEAVKPDQGAGPGNEKRCFFGARKKCDFSGGPCSDAACTVCRIIQQGHFGAGAIASRPPGQDPSGAAPEDHDDNFSAESYVGGIRFASWAHTAKGQGLAPGRRPPPMDIQDFVGHGAGNAVFVADVLVGKADVVSEPSAKPLEEGLHSRVADIGSGVDEIVVFDEAQAAPRALIIFEE